MNTVEFYKSKTSGKLYKVSDGILYEWAHVEKKWYNWGTASDYKINGLPWLKSISDREAFMELL